MKPSILLLALTSLTFAALTSCKTAYKSGQTPDDVYFSPTQPKDEYVRVEKEDDRRYSYDESYDDRYLRMKVQNRYRWSQLDDMYYYDNRYTYSYSHWNNPWNASSAWNYYYNPYCNSCCVNVNPKNGTAFNGGPRTFNLNTFTTKQFTSRNTNPKSRSFSYTTPSSGSNSRTTSDNNDEKKSNAGNLLRSLFSSEKNSSTSNSSNSSSSNNSSSSSSSTPKSSTSSSSGSTAPVRRF